jgi:hypothetical protein
MVHYLIVKMISQIVQYFANQKDHPNHVGQVQINLSRLKGWFFFYACPNGVLLNWIF